MTICFLFIVKSKPGLDSSYHHILYAIFSAGIKRPVTPEDREWASSSLAQRDRFTGLGWILAPEPPALPQV